MTESRDRGANARDDLLTRERIRYQWMLDSVSRFRFFFAGLVFAMLSFSVQFAVPTGDRAARWCQALSWMLLLLTGMLALRDAGGLTSRNTQQVFDGLGAGAKRAMWALFILGVALSAAARILADGGLFGPLPQPR